MEAETKAMKTILLVEDNLDDALFARRAFSKVCPDATIHVARDGEVAVSYLSGAGEYQDRNLYPLPSLVLLDLKLPRKSGLEVLHWMRNTPGVRELPVVVLTSSDQPQDVARASELGVTAYHVKPVNSEGLIAVARLICEAWAALK